MVYENTPIRIMLHFPRRGFAFIHESEDDKNAAWIGVTGGQAGELMVEMMMV